MNLIPDIAVFQKRLGALPLATYTAGETVLVAGSRTGRLLILKKGVAGRQPCRRAVGCPKPC
jgi:CRP/FNR family transcriptional regulator, cyclic AMP receptor protein